MLFGPMHHYVSLHHRNELPAIFNKLFEKNECIILKYEKIDQNTKEVGLYLWNALPVDVRNIYSNVLFKKQLKETLLQLLE